MNTNHKKSVLMIHALLLSCAGVYAADGPPGVGVPVSKVEPSAERPYWVQATVEASNRYVTEGIDNVPGSGFVFGEVAGGYSGFTLGVWYAEALSDAYNEINVYGDYTLDLGPVEAYVGLNYLYYPSGADPKSWEVYAGFEWAFVDWLSLFAETYYDFDDVRGGFIEAGLAGDVPLADDRVCIRPYMMFGIDYGYVSGVHRLRANNFQIGIECCIQVTRHVELFAGVSHSFAMSNLNRIGEGDVTWGGGGLRIGF